MERHKAGTCHIKKTVLPGDGGALQPLFGSLRGIVVVALDLIVQLSHIALDGGRIVMILAEMITRKKIPAKVEAVINGVGLALLLLLSVVIMFKDIIGLF